VTYQGLAELYERKGDSEKAARFRQLFETIHPSAAESPKPEQESESLQEEIPPEGEEVATATMAELYVEQGHLDKAIDVYRKILDAAPETEGVEKRIAELEREVADFKKGRTLLSVLEGWRDRLQEEAPTSLQASEPPSIDSERLAAFLKKYVKDPDL
jgi:tetratricopeptide (TPR) repeat protein